MQLVLGKQCFAFAIIVYINSQAQYFHKDECSASQTAASTEKLCAHTHMLLSCIRMASGEDLMVKQPIFHSSPLH